MPANAAITFEPDGYALDGPKLMGRQAAGYAFLRAAVAGRGDDPVVCHTPSKSSADAFVAMVRSLDAGASAKWIPASRLDMLASIGALYIPGPAFGDKANLRLRIGPGAYSLIGITHTTASHAAMDAIAGLLQQPLMPWDALICTSEAVLRSVRIVLEATREYLDWRHGRAGRNPEPQLPVIPLGVHCRDFEFSDAERAAARKALGIGADEIVAVFVGRLSFHAKAHPHAMYRGLERAVERTRKSITLVQCGWFANETIERSFQAGAAKFAPGVKSLFTDGKSAEARRRTWAAADLFISLSDNVQETFGLTPIEAMAAALPSVVTDWNGYKDTVRNGIDGFRIATAMPETGLGERFARVYEAGEATYDHYTGLVCRTVSVDMDELVDRLSALISDAELRRRMGAAARARAQAEFDWTQVYGRYRDLYGELAELRAKGKSDKDMASWLARAPRSAPARLDPYTVFAHYPSVQITPATQLAPVSGSGADDYSALVCDGLFGYLADALPGIELVAGIFTALANGASTPRAIAEHTSTDVGRTVVAISVLAKMALIRVKG